MRLQLLLLFLLHLPFYTIGQVEVSQLNKYSIQVWSTDDGLPSNNLLQVLQDKKGYIWISSFNGLIRFDGNTFDVYNSELLPELKSNGFSTLSEDLAGNLYFGTLTSGLLKFDGSSFSLSKIEKDFSGSITGSITDRKGKLWVAVKNNGVYYKEEGEDNFIRVENVLFGSNLISDILETDKGQIWFATDNNGIVVYDGSGYSQLDNALIARKKIICINEYDNRIFLGTSDGLVVYENNEWSSVRGTDGYYINALAHDANGNLWLATETGIIRLQLSGVVEYLTEEDGLPSRQISSLIFDNEDNIWLTSKRGGLIMLRNSNFNNISTKNGLSSRFVNSVFELNGGVMAIGNDNGGIDLMKNGIISPMNLKTNLQNISIKDIIQDKHGNVWIATYKGLLKVNGENETLFAKEEGMASDNVRCLFEDRSGNIWVGAKDGGLVRLGTNGSKKIYSIENGLSDNYVFCINQLPNGDIIVGTYHGGINIIATTGEIELLNVGQDESSPLIFNMAIINDEEYWLATDVGLYKYKEGEFYKFGSQEGLPVATIFDVEMDSYGYLWLTSNMGLLRVGQKEVEDVMLGVSTDIEARLYDEKDGMLSRACTGATKMFASADGNIWVPTSMGVSVVNPANIFINTKKPPLFIKAVTIDDKTYTTNLDELNLAPESQRMTIDYTALSYYSPAKIKFKYRLRGFEKDWNDVGNLYKATYMNLPDGQFTFEVIAANNDGVWNEVPATIEITIAPFFYESRIFYLLMGSFLLFMIFIIYWIRIRVVEVKNKELHKLNSELDSFVYSVSHDLRAPLTSILGLINISKLDKDKSNIMSYMGKIEASVNKLDEFIKDIINYSRNVRLKVDVEDVDLKVLIEDTLEGLAYMNTDSEINVSVDSSINSIIQSDKTRLQIILNNIISNSFRYYKNYINDPFIKIKIVVSSSKALIIISDNGVGIKPDRLGKIFDMFYRASDTSKGSGLGLYIAKESMGKLEGTIAVESEFERGTKFTLTIPAL